MSFKDLSKEEWKQKMTILGFMKEDGIIAVPMLIDQTAVTYIFDAQNLEPLGLYHRFGAEIEEVLSHSNAERVCPLCNKHYFVTGFCSAPMLTFDEEAEAALEEKLKNNTATGIFSKEKELHINDFASFIGLDKTIDGFFIPFVEAVRESFTEFNKSGKPNPVKGLSIPELDVEEIGRNEPCPCSSGKKFKKCCGK